MNSSSRTGRDERGTATAFVVGMAIVLLACAGLVVDGGTALNARMRLADDVEQAARAGAQEIDVATLRDSGDLVLDSAAAEDRARVYLVGRGYTVGTVHADQDTVQVAATYEAPTKLLSLISIDSFTVSASATAEAVTE
jgi:Flp pilus assembly protein TadG